jgi:Tfp pilus assembly protein PilN
MIEINLLPGSGKKAKKSSGGAKLNLGASLESLRGKIRDPWMLGAIGSSVVAVLATGFLYTTQNARQSRLDEALEKAVQDSTRYATVLRSLNMIRAIDDDRYIWPHVMDEVSNALPPYTWIVSLGFSGGGQATAPIRTIIPAANEGASGRKHRIATEIVKDTVKVRLVGNTVDIQALTRFMKQLEVSPFLEQVQLVRSERATDNGKDVTQFQLDMLYTRPGAGDVRRVPLAVSVR